MSRIAHISIKIIEIFMLTTMDKFDKLYSHLVKFGKTSFLKRNSIERRRKMNQNDSEKQFLTVEEFADKIGVSKSTVRRWDREGLLKPNHITLGGQRRYSPEQVDEYKNRQSNDS